jgi:hypothetical protein
LKEVLPVIVADASDVARFLFTGHLKGSRVRASAFLPPSNDLRLSVCVTDGLDVSAIHSWGQKNVATVEREPKGFALLHVHDIVAERLSVERDDVPPRHAEIVGWPEEKEARLDIAKQLVEHVAAVELR